MLFLLCKLQAHKSIITLSTFRKVPERHQQVDYKIIVNGWIFFYKSNGELGKDQDWLNKAGYIIAEFNCHGISNLLTQFNEYFHFPSYFRNNLDALNDCMEDIEISGTGLVIVLKNLDKLKKEDSECLLNILVNIARSNFILGKRMLVLAHVAGMDFMIEQSKVSHV